MEHASTAAAFLPLWILGAACVIAFIDGIRTRKSDEHTVALAPGGYLNRR